jgi:HSP20 family protein
MDSFEQLRSSVNRMMSDFEGNLRGQGGRRRSGGVNEWDMGGGAGRGRATTCCANPSCPCGSNCSCGSQCRCGSATQRMPSSSSSAQAGQGFGGFPSSQWGGGGAYNENMLEGQGGGFGGQQHKVKGQDELKSMDTEQQHPQLGGAAALRPTQLQPAQPGHLLRTFQPQQIMKAKCNVEELADKFVVTAEMPGFDKSNVKINVSDDGMLSIKGEQTKEWVDQSRDKKYCLAERSFSNIQRTLRIPKNVDPQKIAASYENGVLHVCLPKNPELEASKQKQEIQIQ